MAQPGAETRWEIAFVNVQDLVGMEAKFDKSPFIRRCASADVCIAGSNLVCSFGSTETEQQIKKDCIQTFSHYGKLESCIIRMAAQPIMEISFQKIRKIHNVYSACVLAQVPINAYIGIW